MREYTVHILKGAKYFHPLALSCPKPYPPINGQLVQPCLEKFSSRCVITCNHGYHLNGTGFLECNKDGGKNTEWNLFENSCEGNIDFYVSY